MDKKHRYFEDYLKFGSTSIISNGIVKPQCVLCNVVLSAELMEPSKLKQHLETKHPDYVTKDIEFFWCHEAGLKR